MSALDLTSLRDLERQGWDALSQERGGDLNDSPPWDAYELTQVRRVPVSHDVAALVYRATASRHTEGEPFVALMTSVYRLLDGEPRLVLYQQTTITH